MQLSVPKLSEADTGSFPLVPEEVASWLAGLDTLNTSADARELLRGLTHSNRLVNDLDRRRAALSLFVPPLRALHEQLMASTSAQKLASKTRKRHLMTRLHRQILEATIVCCYCSGSSIRGNYALASCPC